MRRSLSRSVLAGAEAAGTRLKTCTSNLYSWLSSPQGRGVLKCTIAYTLASLATFVGPVSGFLGKPDGKHVVATITVYFHASRSAGSMIEATFIATVAIAYALTVSILSMVTSVLVGSVLGMVTLAHVLVVIVFIGGGFGFMAWVKQRMGNPLVNVGSTLASLAIISVVTKENAVVYNVFSNQKILQVLKMLPMGIACAATVNLVIWRVSARALLRKSMEDASVSLAKMISIISSSSSNLLTDMQVASSRIEFNAAASSYASAQGAMKKNLREAKFEHFFLGNEKVHAVEKSVVSAMGTLAQSVRSLKSASDSQLELLRQNNGLRQHSFTEATNSEPRDAHEFSVSVETAQSSDQTSRLGKTPLRKPADTFDAFLLAMKPHVEELSTSLFHLLKEPSFTSEGGVEESPGQNYRHDLNHVLVSFNFARAAALEDLYDLVELAHKTVDQNDSGFEEIAAACGHFSFSLQSLGEEMRKYLDLLEDLNYVTDNSTRSWRWLLWWRKGSRNLAAMPYEPAEAESLIQPAKKPVLRGMPRPMVERRDSYHWLAAPDASKISSSLAQYVLKFLRALARDDILFGLKVGTGAALWASLAFTEKTRDWYNHYRGEWGLLSFMIVCSMTVGASNTTGWSRFLGTFFGAVFTITNWTVSQGNGVALAVLGSFVAFWNFYLIVARGKAPLGRMTILAYNVSTLYAYSLSQKVDDNDDDEGGIHPIIMDIVKHRAISVTAGIMWGLIVCRLVWPISARKKFKEGISVLFLQMGLIWRRGPLAILLRSDCSQNYLKRGEQAAMQRYADKLEGLRQSAASEFELRGPFPFQTYGRILKNTNRILDGFYSMSLVTQLKGNLTPGERALLEYTAPERALLCDRICHVFQVLASSMMLEYPLTDAVPSVVGPRDRLLAKIFEFRKLHALQQAGEEAQSSHLIMSSRTMRKTSLSDDGKVTIDSDMPTANVVVKEKDYALLYAYALVAGQVAEELKIAEREAEALFGVLSEDMVLLV